MGNPANHWNTSQLYQKPDYEVTGSEGPIQAILYAGEPYRGEETQVFAYMGVPEAKESSFPAMVCVHGGGGRAFKEWVALWNARGYAAIAMDLAGCGPDGERLPWGGPGQGPQEKFDDLFRLGWKDCWTYHAVASVIRGHSIVRSLPGVDPKRTGVTGISWGGYLTCILAGVDTRFACAIPVYGCGFLQNNSGWMDVFSRMNEHQRRQWHDLCDPSVYFRHSTMPMFFLNGTNDKAYPLDSYQRSYSVVKGPLTLAIRHDMKHSHPAGWAPQEIYTYTDHLFRGTPGLPQIGAPVTEGNEVSALVRADRELAKANLVYTLDHGDWLGRTWHEVPGYLGQGRVHASLPDGAMTYFLAVVDAAGNYVSSWHVARG